MSFQGLKKQFNKANQFVVEKIGNAKGTELDEDFLEMERKTDIMMKIVEEVIARTHELLQPNPASRAKLSTINSFSKLRGHPKTALYLQPEGQLGDCMIKYGKELGEDSMFGGCLVEVGEAFSQAADIKYTLESVVKQDFIEPLHHLQNKDLKEVFHHRKKLAGRRLDYDCKKRKQGKGSSVTEEEINMAEEKFEESKNLAETAMFNLLENDVEQISQLAAFIDAKVAYHQQALDIMTAMSSRLKDKCNTAVSRPKKQHIPKRVASSNDLKMNDMDGYDQMSNSTANSLAPTARSYGGGQTPVTQSRGQPDLLSFDTPPHSSNTPMIFHSNVPPPPKSNRFSSAEVNEPRAKALYDFEPENEGELGFKEGDIIKLTAQIDENWYEGSINGMNGFFPINYVEVIQDVK